MLASIFKVAGRTRLSIRLAISVRSSSVFTDDVKTHASDDTDKKRDNSAFAVRDTIKTERFDLTPSTKARNRVTVPIASRPMEKSTLKTVVAKRRARADKTRDSSNHTREDVLMFERPKRIITEEEYAAKNIRTFENAFVRVPKTNTNLGKTSSLLSDEIYDTVHNDFETRSGDLLEEEHVEPQRIMSSPISRRRENPIRTYRKSVVRYKVKDGNDVLFGISPCIIALMESRREIHMVFIKKGLLSKTNRGEFQQIHSICRDKGFEIKEVDKASLDHMSGGRPHQGICMEVSRLYFEKLSEDEIISMQQPSTDNNPRLCVALDEIKDPMNFGAVLRSSYFMGVDKVIVSRKNCCPLTPVVSKASAGTMETMEIYAVTKLSDLLKTLSLHGWDIVGTANLSTDCELQDKPVVRADEYSLVKPTILVMGNEGYGVRHEILKTCSKLISIPPGRQLHSHIDSLNVSVVTGILLYALMRGKVTS